MLRGRSLATPSDCLSNDGFVGRPLCAWKGSPANASPQALVLIPEMLYPHGVAALLTVRGELPRRFCLAGSMLLCEARPGPPPVNRRRAVSPSPTYS